MSKRQLLVVFNLQLILWCAGCGRTGYHQRGDEWHWGFYGGSGYETKKLNVDSETFEVFDDSGYAKDSTTVFFDGEKIKNADAPSFDLLTDQRFGIDANVVYIKGQVVGGADPESFQIFEELFGRDAKNLYCGTIPMGVEFPDEFEVFQWDGRISKCSKHHAKYCFGQEYVRFMKSDFDIAYIPLAYSRDGKNYYYGPAKIEGVDYQSFEIIGVEKARDKNREYRGAFPVEAWPKRREKFLGAKDQK